MLGQVFIDARRTPEKQIVSGDITALKVGRCSRCGCDQLGNNLLVRIVFCISTCTFCIHCLMEDFPKKNELETQHVALKMKHFYGICINIDIIIDSILFAFDFEFRFYNLGWIYCVVVRRNTRLRFKKFQVFFGQRTYYLIIHRHITTIYGVIKE